MRKTYRAFGTIVSLGVYAHGMTERVEFAPLSNYDGRGGSIYTTDDEEIQTALENRADFGQMFVLVDNRSYEELNAMGEPSHTGEQYHNVEPSHTDDERELRHVKVESIADAKIWLIDNCGWKPANRITKKGLVEAADTYGIVFDGI